MKKSKKYENLIQEQYASNGIFPPIWQVIFQEGMRANHILFDPNDIKIFDTESAKEIKTPEKPEQKKIMDAALEILKASELNSMRSSISELNLSQRRTLYHLYRKRLSSWQSDMKSWLH